MLRSALCGSKSISRGRKWCLFSRRNLELRPHGSPEMTWKRKNKYISPTCRKRLYYVVFPLFILLLSQNKKTRTTTTMERDETTTIVLLTTSTTTTTATMIESNNKLKRPASAPPSMESLSTDSTSSSNDSSDESSLDDSMGSRASKKSCCGSTGSGNGNHKRVSWDQIHTREYTLVVGDHPMCQDGLPVSLGWDHADCSSMTLQQQHTAVPLITATNIRERQQSYVFPRRLSYEERRDRLLNVSNLTLDQIKNDEIDLVVRTLREVVGNDDDDVLSRSSYRGMVMTMGGQDDEDEEDALMDRDGDPLADMMGLVDATTAITTHVDDTVITSTTAMMMLPGLNLEEGDLGDITNFAWTDNDDDE
jgi:hypothetical protein